MSLIIRTLSAMIMKDLGRRELKNRKMGERKIKVLGPRVKRPED
jgi:hypothetical protein